MNRQLGGLTNEVAWNTVELYYRSGDPRPAISWGWRCVQIKPWLREATGGTGKRG